MINVANWGWPQFVLLALNLIAIGIAMAESGDYSTRSFMGSVIGGAIEIFILSKGGFFVEMGWPQYVTFGLLAIGLISAFAHNGEGYEVHFTAAVFSTFIHLLIYYLGGFFA